MHFLVRRASLRPKPQRVWTVLATPLCLASLWGTTPVAAAEPSADSTGPSASAEPLPELPPFTEPTSAAAAASDDTPPQADVPPSADASPSEPVIAVPMIAVPVSEKAADEKKAKTEVQFKGDPGSGMTADFGEKFSMNLKGRFQARYQLDAAAPDDAGSRALTQAVVIQTARIHLGGHLLTRDLNYLIQLAVAARDYRDGATSPVYDAFLDYKAHRDISLKLGQYFVPFDRLRTVKESALQMADRPRPVGELTLDRDVGLTAYSDHFLGDQSIVAYRLGAFGGGGTNVPTAKTPGVLLVGRLELRPLGAIDDDSEGDLTRRDKPALALGVAVAGNWNTNRLRSTTGTTFAAGVTDYFHAAADVVFKWRGFAIEGELLMRQASTDTIVSVDPAVPNAATQSGRGWIVQASYVFETPLELVARISKLYAHDGTDPVFVELVARAGQELGGGVNYYVNGHKLKFQAHYLARMPGGFVFEQAEQTAHLVLDVTM